MEIEDLIAKWTDVFETDDDWTVKNLTEEFISDLKDLTHAK